MPDISRRLFLHYLSSALAAPVLPGIRGAQGAAARPVSGMAAALYEPLPQAHLNALFFGAEEGSSSTAIEQLADELDRSHFTPQDLQRFLSGDVSERGFAMADWMVRCLQPFAGQSWAAVTQPGGAGTLIQSLVSSHPILPDEMRGTLTRKITRYFDAFQRVASFVGDAVPCEGGSLIETRLQALSQAKLGFARAVLARPGTVGTLQTVDPFSFREMIVNDTFLSGPLRDEVLAELSPQVEDWRFSQASRHAFDGEENQPAENKMDGATGMYRHALLTGIGLPHPARQRLASAGFDVCAARPADPETLSADAVLAQAIAARRTLVSQDQAALDFSCRPLHRNHGVIVLPPAGSPLLSAALEDVATHETVPRTRCGWIGRAQHYRDNGMLEIYALRPGGRGEAEKYLTGQRRYAPQP